MKLTSADFALPCRSEGRALVFEARFRVYRTSRVCGLRALIKVISNMSFAPVDAADET